jgi:uncharacterized protein YcbK (DUF882 family)
MRHEGRLSISPDSIPSTRRTELTRRGFIKLGAFALLSGISTSPCFAAVRGCLSNERALAFYNTHTEEALEKTYWLDGDYLPDALSDINHIMRDHRTEEIKPIDPRLLDFLHLIKKRLKSDEPFHIISGYRSPETNAFLRSRSNGVARKSYHLYGQAADIRLPGCRLSLLRRAAIGLKRGGVGFYEDSNFVHVDIGRVRCW